MPALDLRRVRFRLGEATRAAARALELAGVETPWLDARLLIAAATGRAAADLIARPADVVAQHEWERLEALIERRCRREPISRILGEREFYGRPFLVTPATLDPRPDSETLIEAALEIARKKAWRTRPVRILDIGTGSGCLLVTLLAELPLASGLGTDVSEEAMKVAAANAQRHGVTARARFARRDALEGVEGTFDLVVANPPYVATAEISRLSPEVREHDPRAALDGGGDGLDLYRKICPGLARVVACGSVVLEVGAGQARAVADLLRASVAEPRRGKICAKRDLGGHDRCVAMEIQL